MKRVPDFVVNMRKVYDALFKDWESAIVRIRLKRITIFSLPVQLSVDLHIDIRCGFGTILAD